ncbi:MAG: hypothetical protein D6800_02505, partial [Candidatus Zixiibacteriota bacterium]
MVGLLVLVKMENARQIVARESAISSVLSKIVERFGRYEPFVELSRRLDAPPGERTVITGLSGSALSLLLTNLAGRQTPPVLVITETPNEAQDLYEDLVFLLGDHAVGHFPSRQILPYDFRAPVGEVLGRRIATLSGMLDSALRVIVAPVRAVMEPTMPVSQLRDHQPVVGVRVVGQEQVAVQVLLGRDR